MKTARPHPHEAERLKALKALDILDSVMEDAYDDLAELASTICNTPVALVTLIDEKRQWFKARVGVEETETPRDLAICSHAILQDDAFIIEDLSQDERFVDNPLITEPPHIRFYAGMPLHSDDYPMGTLCVIDTEPRQLTEKQRDSLKRLAKQVEQLFTLRKQVKELEQAVSHKDDFISMINHELRTPLTSILGGVTLLNSGKFGDFSAPVERLLQITQRNGKRLLHIINEVLDVSALRSGQFQHQPKAFDLVGIVKQSLELIKPFAKDKGSTISFASELTEASVFADPARIAQVLQNLLSNAVKYSTDQTPIEVKLNTVGPMYWLTVTNQGPGIPEEEQSRLFEKFFKTKTEHKGSPQGTGLGLYICKQIIALSHGEIGCHSIPDEDTSFWFTLPFYDPAESA